jgi:type IV secretory pathway TraG/TraD family ATPase VirD4
MVRTSDNGLYLGLHLDPETNRTHGHVFAPDVSNTLFVGPPRVGKTNLIMLNAALLHRPMVFEDNKPELAPVLGPLLGRKPFGSFRAVNAWNEFADDLPYMKDSGWNGCRDIKRKSNNFPDDIRNLMIGCNGNHGQGGDNAYFYDGATDAGCAILQELCRTDPNAHLGQFLDIVSKPYGRDNGKAIGLLLHYIDLLASPDPIVAALAGQPAEGSKSSGEICATLKQAVNFLLSPALRASMQGPGIDWAAFKNSAQSLALVTPSDKIISHRGYRRMFWQTALRELVRAPVSSRVPPVMLFLDEFPQLGYMPEFLAAAATAPGRGVRLVVCVQDFPQLEGIYDKRWRTWLTTASCIAAFAPRDPYTSEILSDLCGEAITKVMTESENADGTVSKNRHYEHRRLFEAWRLRNMPPGQLLVLMTGQLPFFTKVQNYWETKYAHLFARNPHLPQLKRGRR